MADVDQFDLEYEHRDGRVVVRLSGELDAATAPRLHSRLTDNAHTDVRQVVIDLEAVEFIDSTGLRALLQSREHVVAAGRAFAVTNPTDAAVRLFQLTGTQELLMDDGNGA